jgi:hypothetical protein
MKTIIDLYSEIITLRSNIKQRKKIRSSLKKEGLEKICGDTQNYWKKNMIDRLRIIYRKIQIEWLFRESWLIYVRAAVIGLMAAACIVVIGLIIRALAIMKIVEGLL